MTPIRHTPARRSVPVGARVALLVAAVATLLLSTPAAAEQPITYQQALTAAEQSNPTLAAAALSRDQAEATLLSARGLFDPALGATGSWSHSQRKGFFQGFPFEADMKYWVFGTDVSGALASGTTYALNADFDRNTSRYVTQFGEGLENESIQDAYTANLNVSVTQQLLKGHRFAYNTQNITRARTSLDVAELTLERTRQEALASTASAYWTWAYQVRLQQIAEDSARVAEEALRVGRLKVDAGEVAPVEATRLEAALVQAQANALDARHATRQAADALLLLMGESPGAEVLPATPPGEVPVVELDATAAVEVALAQNLDLAVARANLDAVRIEHSVARHATLPSLAATASAGVGSQQDALGSTLSGLAGEEAFPTYSLGGSFSMPLGNRAARGERDRTLAALHQQELAVAETERVVQSQVEQQVRLLSSAARRVELADVNLRLAEQTLSAEEALYEGGRLLLKDVLESRTVVDQARAEAVKARIDYRLAQVDLLRLQGQLDEEVP